jgi:hypothetical protein
MTDLSRTIVSFSSAGPSEKRTPCTLTSASSHKTKKEILTIGNFFCQLSQVNNRFNILREYEQPSANIALRNGRLAAAAAAAVIRV